MNNISKNKKINLNKKFKFIKVQFKKKEGLVQKLLIQIDFNYHNQLYNSQVNFFNQKNIKFPLTILIKVKN